MNGIERIAAERQRQINEEGFKALHDDEHTDGEIIAAARAYMDFADGSPREDAALRWPWDDASFKPKGGTLENEIQNLVKAGALVAAEIDRLLRSKGAKA